MKKILIKTLIIFFIVIMIFNNAYATGIVVTEEKLQNSFKNFIETYNSSYSNAAMNINKNDKTIKLSIDENNYIINYDLSGKPTFSIDLLFTLDMTQDYWTKESEKTSALLFLFILIANMANIKAEDSLLYSIGVSIDNLSMSPATTPSNSLEYAKSSYDKDYAIKDDLFTLSTTKISETSTEYKVKSTLVVNNDADFSVMSDYMNNAIDSFSNSMNSIYSEAFYSINNNSNLNNSNSINKLPQTGRSITLKDSLYALIGFSLICIFVLLFTNYRYKNITKK